MRSSAIKVVARFRPPNALELSQGGDTVVSFENDDTLSLDVKSVVSPQTTHLVMLADTVREARIQENIRLRLIDVLICLRNKRIFSTIV
jgi:hypothetical protein